MKKKLTIRMKDRMFISMAIIISMTLFFFAVLYGIGNQITKALAPFKGQLEMINKRLASIEIKTANIVAANNQKNGGPLEMINKKLTTIEAKQDNLLAANNQRNGGQQNDPNKVHTIPVGDSPILGKANAPVTITVFLDIQCPFCNRFFPAAKEAVKAYPDKVKLIVKNFPLPFHPNAKPAAKLALAASKQGKYYEMLDLLLQNGAAVTDDKIKGYAKTLNMDVKKLMEDYKNDASWEKLIEQDMALARQIGVNGTTSFYINGKATSARDANAYKQEIDKIR